MPSQHDTKVYLSAVLLSIILIVGFMSCILWYAGTSNEGLFFRDCYEFCEGEILNVSFGSTNMCECQHRLLP